MNNPADPASCSLHPINELTPRARKILGKKAQITDIAPRKRINPSEYRKWFVFLMSGTVGISKGKGPSEDVTGGTLRANLPLFGDSNAPEYATTKTPCKIIVFERQLYETLLRSQSSGGYEVLDVQVSQAEGDLFQQLYLACTQQDLHLPSMPEVAQKIRKLTDDPDAGIPDLTTVIQTEPIVAGSILSAANSAMYKGASKIDNIKTAVIRLGLKTTRDLAVAAALREAFHVKDRQIMKRMRLLWEHSVNISSFSYVIAKMADGLDLDPEKALMAGLLHDIGVVGILSHIDQSAANTNMAEVEATIQKLHSMAGILVSTHWRLGGELEAIIEHAEDWWHDSGEDSEYCDIVILAHLCEATAKDPAADLPPVTTIPAARNMGFDMNDENWVATILQQGEVEIAGIRQMLNS